MIFFLRKDEFLATLQKALETFRVSDAVNRIGLLREVGLLDQAMLEGMIAARTGSFSGLVMSDLWQCLERAKIVLRTWNPSMTVYAHFQLDQIALALHLDEGTFKNIFHPARYLHERYAVSIVSIDVKDQLGDNYRGSGFIVGRKYSLIGPAVPQDRLLITCKHNVEDKTIEAVQTASGMAIQVSEPWLSGRSDIAIFPIQVSLGDHPISLSGSPRIFDRCYTIGFPSVPRAYSALVGHRGEVNAVVERYQEQDSVVLISNLVSPGSSGCPVLDWAGRCIGMTTNWLEGEFGGERARFSAAIPVSTIRAEIEAMGRQWWDHESLTWDSALS